MEEVVLVWTRVAKDKANTERVDSLQFHSRRVSWCCKSLNFVQRSSSYAQRLGLGYTTTMVFMVYNNNIYPP